MEEETFNYSILGIWQGSEYGSPLESRIKFFLKFSSRSSPKKFIQIFLQISLEYVKFQNFETAFMSREKLRERFTLILRVCSSTEFKIKTLFYVFINFFWHFLLSFIIKIVIILIPFFDEVSNFRNRTLTNQKQELVVQNCQWNCMFFVTFFIFNFNSTSVKVSNF